MSELQYPKIAPHLQQLISLDCDGAMAMSDGQLLTWQGRMAIADDITKAIHQEFVHLRHFWSLGTPGSEQQPEEVAAKFLGRFAARAEQACIVQVLQPSAAVDLTWSPSPHGSEQMEDLESRCKKLEDEIAEVDKQLLGMREMETEFLQARGANDLHDNLDKLVAYLSIDECSTASSYASTTPFLQEAAGQLDQCLERLALVDLAFSHVSAGLEEEEKRFVERERVALSRAWAHFPRQVLDPQITLAGLR